MIISYKSCIIGIRITDKKRANSILGETTKIAMNVPEITQAQPITSDDDPTMKIAYITNCFGTQSHTFIRREIQQLERIGVDITLFGIRKDPHGIPDIQNNTTYLYPLSVPTLILCNLKTFWRRPLHYFKGFIKAITSPELSLARRSKMAYHYMAATKTAEQLTRANITHIHAHFMNVSASIAMYASYHSNIPFSITVHSAGTFGTPHILGIPQKLEQAQHLAMISNYNIDYFDNINACKNKSSVVRCGLDISEFDFNPKKINKDKTIKLLAVGRFVEKKGFTHLIEAVRLAQEKGMQLELAIIGDGPLKQELQKQAAPLNNAVTFLGQQPSGEVRRAMNNCDIVVIPSVTSASGEMEGLPVVIMEAMAVGRLVISTKHSGIPEIIINQETGYLADEKSPQQIVSAIETILEKNNEEQIIIAARKKVQDEFNIETIAKLRKQLFETLNKGQ